MDHRLICEPLSVPPTAAQDYLDGQFPANLYPTYSALLDLRVGQAELVGEGD